MDVDEGGLLTVQFNALSDKRLFFYILCLEETGNYVQPTTAASSHSLLSGAISFLNKGEEEAPEVYQKDHLTVCPPAKFLVSTEIPQGMSIVVCTCTCISPHCAGRL